MPGQTLRKLKKSDAPGHFAGEEVLPGYRLLSPLGRGGFGEVWKCEAPGGLQKAVKFVKRHVDRLHEDAASADEELNAIQRIKDVRHPFLLSIERVESKGEELLIISELADKSLYALYQAYREAGQRGIPRLELLRFMREAAEALDVLNVRNSLLHLDVKPQNLFLVGDHVKLGDFGLVFSIDTQLSDTASSAQRGGTTPLYTSPELLQGGVSRFSDQYSLAIVYQELLTGVRPLDGSNSRQLMMQHLQGEPDLSPLPSSDRAAVARALNKGPAARFASCAEFVQALADTPNEDTNQALAILSKTGTSALEGTGLGTVFRSHLPRDLLRQRVDGFCRKWQGHVLHSSDRDLNFRVKTPRGFWQRFLGRRPGLEVRIHLAEVGFKEDDGAAVTIAVRPHELCRAQAMEALELLGQMVVEGLRDHLQVAPRRRGQERLLWPYEFDAKPVFVSGRVVGQPIRCQGKDISMNGIGFIAPREIPTGQLHVQLPLTALTPAVLVAARIVRNQKRVDGTWDVGAILLAPVDDRPKG
jgi:serine/threonine protein kinase